jgi:hypothetical protein
VRNAGRTRPSTCRRPTQRHCVLLLLHPLPRQARGGVATVPGIEPMTSMGVKTISATAEPSLNFRRYPSCQHKQ